MLFDMQGKWSLLQVPEILTSTHTFLDATSALMMTGWFTFQCILYVLPVGGPISQGVELKSGRRLDYQLNGKFVMVICLLKWSRVKRANVKTIFIRQSKIEIILM